MTKQRNFTCRLGGTPIAEQMQSMEASGFEFSRGAVQFFEDTISSDKRVARIRLVTPKDLGLVDEVAAGFDLPVVIEQARAKGYLPCHPEVALHLRRRFKGDEQSAHYPWGDIVLVVTKRSLLPEPNTLVVGETTQDPDESKELKILTTNEGESSRLTSVYLNQLLAFEVGV